MNDLSSDVTYFIEQGDVLSCRSGGTIKVVALMSDQSTMIQTTDTHLKTTQTRFYRAGLLGAVVDEMVNFAPLGLWLKV